MGQKLLYFVGFAVHDLAPMQSLQSLSAQYLQSLSFVRLHLKCDWSATQTN